MIEEFDISELRRFIDDGVYFCRKLWDEELFDYQNEIVGNENNRQIIRWGRQSGKTFTLGRKALKEGSTIPGSNVLITAASQRQAIELYRGVQEAVRTSHLTEDQWGIVDNKKTEMVFSHGGRIKAIPSGNDGRSIRGFTADTIIVDEAAYVPNIVFTQVLSSMLATKEDGEFIIASTPNGKSGFYYDKSRDPYWSESYMSSEDAPKVKKSFIEEQKRQLSDIEYKQEILAQFVVDGTTFFDPDLIDACVHEDVICETQNRFLGTDVARFGADRAVYVSIDAAGNVYDVQFDENVPLTHCIGRIKKLEEKNKYRRILIDETGLGGGVVDPLRREEDGLGHTRGITFTIDRKQSMYNTAKKEMENGNIKINAEFKDLIYELQDLEYELTARGKTKIHAPDNGHDDFADAFALAVWAWKRGQGARGSKKVHTL